MVGHNGPKIKTSRRYRTWTIVNNRFCWLLGVVAKVKNRRHSEVTIRLDSKFRIFAQHYHGVSFGAVRGKIYCQLWLIAAASLWCIYCALNTLLML